jgi:hypothetical protein
MNKSLPDLFTLEQSILDDLKMRCGSCPLAICWTFGNVTSNLPEYRNQNKSATSMRLSQNFYNKNI